MKCFGNKSATYHCKIILLDSQELIQEIVDTTLGQQLLDNVFRHLNLLETAYFGLRFLHTSNQPYWLDPQKKVVKQLKGCSQCTFYFCVKFYAADPCRLVEEITRYQFFLHIKQDILEGRLPVTPELAAELGALVIQSELGDYDPKRHKDGYVREFRLFPNLTPTLEENICELHKTLIGRVPSVAEFNFLEKVRWLEMYGVDLHPVLGEDHTEYFIGLTPAGVIVLRGKVKVSNYFWPRISKVNFKGKYFMLRVRDKNNEENTYGFETPSKDACKHLWKCCVEHHSFFRLVQISQPPGGKTLSVSSRFRYSGRTEKEAQRDASLHRRPPPSFSRTSSRRSNAPSTHEQRADEDEAERRSHCQTALSIPQPVQSASSMYRATSMTLQSQSKRGSPRSVRSAPFSANQMPALFNHSNTHGKQRRSTSVESHASLDARSQRRHRRRRSSGNDSDASSANEPSRAHRKHRSRRNESGSESERSTASRRHRGRRHKPQNYELVDSEAQWREVQRRQAEGPLTTAPPASTATIPRAGRRSGYLNSGMETESELSYQPKRRLRKHRSRSRSPETERSRRLPPELRRHMQFELVDPPAAAGVAADIPYTRVQTDARMPKIKYAARRQKREGDKENIATQERHTVAPQTASFSPSPVAPAAAPLPGGSGFSTSTPMTTAHYSVPAGRPRPVNTLSSYYVTSVTSERASQAALPAPVGGPRSGTLMTSAPLSLARGSLASPRYANVGAPPAQSVEPHHEHSDSGLGNESPNEFTRMTNGSPVLPPAVASRVSKRCPESSPSTSAYECLPPALPPLSTTARPPACGLSPAWTASLPRPSSRLTPVPVTAADCSSLRRRTPASAATASATSPSETEAAAWRSSSTLPRPSTKSSADIFTAYTGALSSRPPPNHVILPPASFQNRAPASSGDHLTSTTATTAVSSPSVASCSPVPQSCRPSAADESFGAGDASGLHGFVTELKQLMGAESADERKACGPGDGSAASTPLGRRRPAGPPGALARSQRSDSAGSLELILTPMLNSTTQASRR